MTNNTDGAALLQVTPEDRDAAAKWLRGVHSIYLAEWIEGSGTAPEWAESPNPDEYSLVQSFARHRISHSLPGDVGMRELIEALRLADALLRGANMDRPFVERKVSDALAKAGDV